MGNDKVSICGLNVLEPHIYMDVSALLLVSCLPYSMTDAVARFRLPYTRFCLMSVVARFWSQLARFCQLPAIARFRLPITRFCLPSLAARV